MVTCLPALLEKEDPLHRVGSSEVKDTMSLQFMMNYDRRNRWVCGSGSVPPLKMSEFSLCFTTEFMRLVIWIHLCKDTLRQFSRYHNNLQHLIKSA